MTAIGKQHHRQSPQAAGERGHQLPCRRILIDVNPLIGHTIARQELLHRVTLRRPPCTGDPDPVVGEAYACRPLGQQVVEDGIQVLIGRIPGLQQVMIEPDFIDADNRRLGVGVGGEQDFSRIRVELARFAQ